MSYLTRKRRLFAAAALTVSLVASVAPVASSATAADEIPQDRPNPPTNVVADPEPGKITVTWDAPLDGPAVTDYLVVVNYVNPLGGDPEIPDCVRDAAPGGVVAQSFECVFDNLLSKTQYRIRVRSRNDLGITNGPVRTVVLGIPGFTDALAIPQDEAITVRWERPRLKGFGHGTPFEYTWELDPAEAPTCVTSGLECTFTGLTNGTSYRIVGSTSNEAGQNGANFTFGGETPSADAPAVTPLPNPVTDIVVGIGSERLAVSWNAPAGGSDVVDYLVTVDEGDQQCVTSGLSCELTGLDNGVRYRVRVASRNTGGSKSVSPGLFTPRPEGFAERLSNIPTKVVVTPGDERVSVRWTAPVNEPGAEVDDYVVSAEPGGHECTTATLTCSINGLTNGTEYILRVRAHNEAGLRSAPPETFTPQEPGAPIVAMAPKRILESRLDPKLVTADGKEQNRGALKPKTRTVVEMAGRAGVPIDARAVVVNVTVIGPANDGFATLYPCTAQPPTASTLNYASGQIIANSTLVGLSGKGTFCVFSSSKTDLAIDVTGFVPANSDLVAVKPARLYETRRGEKLNTVDGKQEGTGPLTAGKAVSVNIGGRAGLPAAMSAAILNVAVIGPSEAGFLTLYPCDQQRPTASTLNHKAGQTIANGVTVKLDPNGDVCIFSRSAADVIVDFLGYTPATSLLTTVTPARLYETRAGNVTFDGRQQATGPRVARQVTTINIAGRAGVPAGATAAVVNVTAIAPPGLGYVTLFPCDEARPLASTLNYAVGEVVANGAFVKLDSAGNICAFTLSHTDLIVDVTGYLAV